MTLKIQSKHISSIRVLRVPMEYKEELLILKSIHYLHSDLLNMNLKRKAFKFHGILGHVPFQKIWGCSLL